MPRTLNVGDRVRLVTRVSNDDPPRGAIGAVVRVDEGENPYIGVDFAEFADQQPALPAGLHNLDGLLMRPTGRNVRRDNLDLVQSAHRLASRADHLVGQWIRFGQNYPDGNLGGLRAKIIAVNTGNAQAVTSITVQIPGFDRGHSGGGYLHRHSREGWYINREHFDHIDITVDDVARAPIGMPVIVARDYQDARVGMAAIIVYPKGQPRPNGYVDERRHGLRVYGMEGHRLNQDMPRRPGMDRDEGYNIPPDHLQCERSIRLVALMMNMREEPAIANRFPAFTDATPLPQDLEEQLLPGGAPVYARTSTGPIRAGTAGVVAGHVEVGGRSHYRVQFDPTEVPGGEWVAQTTAFARLPDTLPLGTIVSRNAVQVPGGYDHYPAGARGVLKVIDEADFGIEMDDPHPICGDLDGNAEEGRGYWMRREMFDVVRIPVGAQMVRGRPPRLAERLQLDRYNPFGDGARGLNPDQIGCTITLVHRDDTLKAMGVPLGATGRIVGIHDNRYTVDFTPMALPHGHDGHGRGFGPHSCWDCSPSWLEIGDKVEDKSQSLAKGDRVTLVFGGSSMPPKDTEGVVLRVAGGAVDVDFYPYRWKYGKQLHGGNDRACATMPAYYLKKVEIAEVEKLKPFFLIGVIDKKVTPLEGHPTFETGTEAEAYKKTIEGAFPYKIQVRKAAKPDENWRERERARFTDGSYRPLPKGWDLTPIVDHFLHLSVKHPGQVAFTPNEEYGQQDRQTNTRPGAYVQKFYPHLDNKQVARYSALAACDGGLEIVNEGKEMARIYMLGAEGMGPESCMKYDFVRSGHGGSRTPIHPIECYDAGDIALAYLRQDGAIVARCLIWPERKLFTRAYGDIAKIIAILEADGYTRGDFVGARLRRVTFDHGGTRFWVCPYVDESNSVLGNPGAMGVVDDGEYLIVTKPGEGQTTNQAMGYIRIDRRFRIKDAAGAVACLSCKGMFDPDEMLRVGTAHNPTDGLTFQQWCHKCSGARAYVCSGFGERVSQKALPRVPNEKSSAYYSRAYLDMVGGFVCDLTGRGYRRGGAIVLEDGSKVCEDAFKSYCFTCAGTGKKFRKEHRDSGEKQFIKAAGKYFSLEYANANPDVLKKAAEDELKRRREHEEKLRKMKGTVGAASTYSTYINEALIKSSTTNISFKPVLRDFNAVLAPATVQIEEDFGIDPAQERDDI